MYLQLWPGASLLGFNLIQFQQMRSESAGCRDRRQITQACVFEVYEWGYIVGERGGSGGVYVSVSECVSVGGCVHVCVPLCASVFVSNKRGTELER